MKNLWFVRAMRFCTVFFLYVIMIMRLFVSKKWGHQLYQVYTDHSSSWEGTQLCVNGITLPFWKEAHAHIHAHTHIQNYQKQKQTLKTPPPVHLSVHGQMTKLTNIYFIELRMNFCHKVFKNRKHACFCLKCATVNRMFPLSEQHTKPCIKKRCLGHKLINSRIK